MTRSTRSRHRRARKTPVITEQMVVGIYMRYLPEDLGAQVRDMAPHAGLETLYTAAKFGRLAKTGAPHPRFSETLGSFGS